MIRSDPHPWSFPVSNMMRALVKARSEPGIWMENVPIPEIAAKVGTTC